MLHNKKIILGIDPGIADTGYGLIEKLGTQKLKMLDYGSIKTNAGLPLSDRLLVIHKELSALIIKYRPSQSAVEELFFSKNAKTALIVGQARGVILLTLMQANLPFMEFTPLQIKQAITSYGRADKKQMQRMVQTLLCLPEIPHPDDAADALAVAITAASFSRIN